MLDKMLNDAERKAYDAGEEAASFGWVTPESCPYPHMSKEERAWRIGFANGIISEKALD